ncbi:MAG: hypothetical protein ACRBHB_15785 [Arenicella sp.]
MSPDMTEPCIFTIVARNYLPYARVLMRSAKQLAPNTRRIVILCDRDAGNSLDKESDFELIHIETLEIPDFPQMALQYSLVELNTAVKPFCFKWLANNEHQKLIYLDPDIKLYGSIEPVLDLLDQNSIVLTPHLTEPISDQARPNEIDMLRVGAYNLGFLALKNSSETQRFLDWWCERLQNHCLINPDGGLFVDQKWIDLAPGLFEGVHISRHPGLNVAYWNLSHRNISSKESSLYSNDQPLIFIHYSGIDATQKVFSVHQNRFTFKDLPHIIKQLANDYMNELNQSGLPQEKQIAYGFDLLHDGEPLSKLVKLTLRQDLDEPLTVTQVIADDPLFRERLVQVLNEPMPNPNGKKANELITRIAFETHQSRADLKNRYPDLFNADAIPFIQWFLTAANSNHILPQECLDHLKNLLAKAKHKATIKRPNILTLIYHKVPFIRTIALKLLSNNSRQFLANFFHKRR